MKSVTPIFVIASISIMLIILALFTCATVDANTLGLSYDRAVDETNIGIYGDYEKDLGIADFEVEGQLQGGDIYLGNIDTAFTFNIGSIGLRLENNNLLKGYELSSIGRTNDIGASLVIPIDSLEVSVGIFGKSGNPFDKIYELENPSDPESAVLKDAGITIKDGSTLNAAVKTEFDVSRFEVGLRALFELAGEGEKAHQAVIDIGTGGNLVGGIDWTVQAQITTQIYGDLIEHESQIISGLEYNF